MGVAEVPDAGSLGSGVRFWPLVRNWLQICPGSEPWGCGVSGFHSTRKSFRFVKESSNSLVWCTALGLVGQISSQSRQKLHLAKSILYQSRSFFLVSSFRAASRVMQADGQARTHISQEMQTSGWKARAPRYRSDRFSFS